ncbi:PREDICTED: heavy metal-associated isoprenylated plant protein 2-like [Ipomoea nil]|uniref:heavy metal-associated isoprenylated plant protein 2-like n=1 Tax=Ipomoea nil TaxID=35883 RepID=UPI0009019460|nr:PREDICTED: heavy metal-associated isoprenylated plant protein 2-like [Ipomoea nil]
MSLLLKKTVVSVDLRCSKCRLKVMKLISRIEGINSIVLDAAKSTVTVIGEADPVCIIKQVRKFRKSAQITSIGAPEPEKKKDEKKDEKNEKKDDKKEVKKDVTCSLPSTCQRCHVWYVMSDDYYSRCNIL